MQVGLKYVYPDILVGMLDWKRASSYRMLKMTPKVLATAHFFQAMTIKLHEEFENSFDGMYQQRVYYCTFTLLAFVK